MSTAGKVLSVLVMLVALVWVMLSATVAQLNRNGTKAVETIKADLAKVTVQVKEAETELQKIIDQRYQDQFETHKQLTVLQAKQTDVENQLSEHKEIFSRSTFQLADAEAVLKLAEADLKQRIADKKADTEALAQAKKDVEQLMADRTALVDRLTELREKFKTTLEENRSLAGRLQKKSAVPATRTTRTARPASFSH